MPNLLPWRILKMQKIGQLWLNLGLFSLLLVYGSMMICKMALHHQIKITAKQNVNLEREFKTQYLAWAKINQQLHQLKQWQEQIKIIQSQKELSKQQLFIFQRIADLLPLTISLFRLNQEQTNLTLMGEANSYNDLRFFLNNLKQTQLIQNVNFKEWQTQSSNRNLFTVRGEIRPNH